MMQRVIETDGSLAGMPLSVQLVAELDAAVWGQGFRGTPVLR